MRRRSDYKSFGLGSHRSSLQYSARLTSFSSHKITYGWLFQAIAIVVALFVVTFIQAVPAQAQNPGCRPIANGNVIDCDTCADLNALNGSVRLQVPPNQGFSDVNAFCRVRQLAPGEALLTSVVQTPNSVASNVDIDYTIQQGPSNLVNILNQSALPNNQSFPNGDAVTTNTNIRISVQDMNTGPPQSRGLIDASVTCSCRLAPPPRATLTLVKEVVNNNTGTAIDTDFTLSFAGPSNGSGSEGNPSVTNASVLTGNYALNEIQLAGYTQTGLTCNGADQNLNDGLDLAADEDVTCTFTNDDLPPASATLTLQKVVVNNNNGTAIDTDFTLTFAGPSNGSGSEGNPSVTNAGVLVGNYTLSESVVAGYSQTNLTCDGNDQNLNDGLDLTANENVTCTFTNDDIAPPRATLTLVKEVVNNNTGTAIDTDFTLSFAGPSNGSGSEGNPSVTNASVLTGNYALNEIQLAGYTQTGLTCNGADQNLNDGLDLAVDEDVTCTFTNDDVVPQTGTVIINKTTIGDDGTFNFTSTNQAVGNFQLVTNGNTAAQTFNNVPIGTFTINEDDPSGAGFDLTDLQCTDSNANGIDSITDIPARMATINLSPNETVECTYINTQRPTTGTLTIEKRVIGANANFTFSGTTPFGNFTLANGQTTTRANLPPGNFIITETKSPIYSLNSITCVGNTNAPVIDLNAGTLTIFVPAGDDVTCTFENGQVRDPRMEEETRRFIHRRVDNLLTHQPDRARMLRRLQDRPPQQGSLKDSGSLKHSDAGSARRSVGVGGHSEHASIGETRSFFNGSVDAKTNNVRALIEGSQTNQARNPFFDAVAGQLAQSGFGQTNFKFGTSLSELRSNAATYEAERQKKNLNAAGLDFSGGYGGGRYLEPRTGLDVWVEGQISRYNDNIGGVDREGDFRILYVGADYVVSPGVLIGVLAQIDDTREDISQTGERGEIDGSGWMAGPYIGARLYKNLYLDIRAAWGTSDNDILLDDTELGLRTGSFDTDRWLVSGTLTGNHTHGAWRFSPQVELAYGHEEYDTYQNSLGLTVQGAEAAIGRLSGTLEVGYQWRSASGFAIEPHASITGIWNFDSDSLVINNTLFATDESRARVEGGVTLTGPTGLSFRAAGNYDGIGGDDFESYGGSLWVSVPLN